MIGFRERLSAAISASPKYAKDIWSLSEDAGLGRKTIYNITNDSRIDTTNSGPGIFGMSRVANLLGISLDYLADNRTPTPLDSSQSRVNALADHALSSLENQANLISKTVSADRLLRLFCKSGGRIEAFSSILEKCDQYYPPEPEDTIPKVKKVGANSLAAITMGCSSEVMLQEAFRANEHDPAVKEALADYRTAVKRGSISALISRDIQMQSEPVRVKMDIVRTLLFVEDATKQKTLLVFASLIV